MPHLLLVEDDAPLRKALRLALEYAGHEVVEASDGKSGLAAFESRPFDLVVTDLIMPEVEGMETIRALRKLHATIPIIAISGGGRGASHDYLKIAKQFGATEVLAKPFDFAVLVAAVTQLLAGNRERQS